MKSRNRYQQLKALLWYQCRREAGLDLGVMRLGIIDHLNIKTWHR